MEDDDKSFHGRKVLLMMLAHYRDLCRPAACFSLSRGGPRRRTEMRSQWSLTTLGRSRCGNGVGPWRPFCACLSPVRRALVILLSSAVDCGGTTVGGTPTDASIADTAAATSAMATNDSGDDTSGEAAAIPASTCNPRGLCRRRGNLCPAPDVRHSVRLAGTAGRMRILRRDLLPRWGVLKGSARSAPG